MTGGFIVAMVVMALAVIVAAPEYAEPPVSVGGPGAGALRAAQEGPVPSLPAGDVDDGISSSEPAELDGYRWPLRGGKIIAYFARSKSGFLQTDGGRMHEGLDIGWTCGAQVTAAHRGKVLAAGREFAGQVGFDASKGEIKRFYKKLGKDGLKRLPNTVVIDDGNGYRSVYKHFEDVTVKAGDKVRAGAVIGHLGQTGGVERCQLQYELVRMDGDWVRVAKSYVTEVGYPRWIRQRVDPLLVLELGATPGPRVIKRVPPPTPAA